MDRAAASQCGVRLAGPVPAGARVIAMTEGQALLGSASLRVDRSSGRVTAECGRLKSWLEVLRRFTQWRVGRATAEVEAARRTAERPDPERVPPSASSGRR